MTGRRLFIELFIFFTILGILMNILCWLTATVLSILDIANYNTGFWTGAALALISYGLTLEITDAIGRLIWRDGTRTS